MSSYDEIKRLKLDETREIANVMFPNEDHSTTNLSSLKSNIWGVLKPITNKQIITLHNRIFKNEIAENEVADIKIYVKVIKRLRQRGYTGDVTFDGMNRFIKDNKAANKANKAEKQAIDDLMNLPFQPDIPKPEPKRPHIPKPPSELTPIKPYIDSNREEIERKREKQKEDVIKMKQANYENYTNILKSRRVYHKRPLPPKEMKPLKSYIQRMREEEKQELIVYIEEHKDNHFEELDDNYLLINVPQKYDEAVNELLQNRDYKIDTYGESKIIKDENKPDAIVTYYLNLVPSVDAIRKYLVDTVYGEEQKRNSIPFKLNFDLSGVFEEHYTVNGVPKVEYKSREILSIGDYRNYDYKVQTGKPRYHLNPNIPILVESMNDIDLIMHYIEIVLFNYSVTESSTKLIFVSSVAFKVHRLRKTTGKIVNLPEEFTKSRWVIVDNEDDNLCWYRFLSICLDQSLINAKTNRIQNRTQVAQKILCEDHGAPYKTKMTNAARKVLSEFDGVTMKQMKASAKKHHINVNIYEYDDETKQYTIGTQWFFDKSYDTHSALLYTKNTIIHIMYVTNAEKLTGILVCPKCRSFCLSTKCVHSNLRMEKHSKKCDGIFRKSYIPEKESKPYCPHILENHTYEYCLAHGLKYTPQTYYMTYDFETMEKVVNEKRGKSTTVVSSLVPLSVACCVKSSDGLETRHWDARENNFIVSWITWMFNKADKIVSDKRKYYASLLHTTDLPKFVHRDLYTVTVLGYNSSRFDSNLFKQYLNTSEWKVDNASLIGSPSAMKQMIITHSDDNKVTKLRFIDAQSFVAGGTLKQFGKDFGGIDNSNKGVFPYEAITTDNFNEVLSVSEPFPYDAFYSSLSGKHLITEAEYATYLNDSKRFHSRWDYLLAYNDNDVEMMIKPIDNLIALNGEFNVDLLGNLSVSKNAVCIKYAFAYKDFDPSKDYGTINEKNTFKPTRKWWNNKCASYYKQDEKFNQSHSKTPRDLSLTVTDDDWDAFMKMYDNSKCHLCGEHFTWDNKPTLDRIDNNKGHEISNCKLACSVCNCLRSDNDEKVTRLRIQLKKYCLLNGLPMTISNEDEYYDLRNAITGGLAITMHRYNIKGETKINHFHYDSDTAKVHSIDSDNVVTHVFGIDFNSLYPSAFSSNPHEFNPYHGGVMYMPGRLIERVTDKQTCMQIIKSGKYDVHPKTVFYANVKLECPKDKINDLINFPPVFRNFNIINNESTIGSYMYNYGKANGIASVDKKDTKLTMTLDTMDEYRHFNCYYLWLLLDLGLIIIDVKSVSVYSAHNGFNPFVNEFMKRRQDILAGVSNGNEKFYKLNMNGSYGYDGMNTEKYSKIKIINNDQAYQAIASDTYVNGTKIDSNQYLIQSNPKTYHCKTCLQVAVFTLDNAKFWYLTFYYRFIKNAIDMNKIHFTHGDTDSMYFAVAGDPDAPNTGTFECVIRDKEFYDANVYKFLPKPNGGIADEKKILGCAIEKYGDNEVSLCPKVYTIWNDDNTPKAVKVKGISLKTNDIKSKDYKDVIDNGTVKVGMNRNLQMTRKSGIPQMSRIEVSKNALTGFNNKLITLPNQACAPYMFGLVAADYVHI